MADCGEARIGCSLASVPGVPWGGSLASCLWEATVWDQVQWAPHGRRWYASIIFPQNAGTECTEAHGRAWLLAVSPHTPDAPGSPGGASRFSLHGHHPFFPLFRCPRLARGHWCVVAGVIAAAKDQGDLPVQGTGRTANETRRSSGNAALRRCPKTGTGSRRLWFMSNADTRQRAPAGLLW